MHIKLFLGYKSERRIQSLFKGAVSRKRKPVFPVAESEDNSRVHALDPRVMRKYYYKELEKRSHEEA